MGAETAPLIPGPVPYLDNNLPSLPFSPQIGRTPSSRPDHSAVTLPPTSVAVDPALTAPASDDPEEKAEFSTPYSGAGYASSSFTDAGDPLMPTRRRTRSLSAAARKSRSGFSYTRIFLLLVIAISAIIFLVRSSILPSPREHITQHLTPFLPASFIAFIGSTGVTNASPHPIIPLLVNANKRWEDLLASQSTTFDRASKTYKSRYGLAPPPGFDKWFAFAIQGRNHTLVDEYDSLMADLLPFRSLSPGEIRRRTAELAQVPGISIVSIRNGVAQVHSKSGKWAPALAFQQMLAAFVRDLPDMDIAINEKPEGRVLPRKQRAIMMEDYGLEGAEEFTPNMSDPMVRPTLTGFKPEWNRDGSVWEALRRSCPTDSPARRLVESIRSAETGPNLQVQGRATSKLDAPTTRRKVIGIPYPPTRELTFVPDVDAAQDSCAKPSAHSLHSAFFSDQRSIEYLYPLFSPSKPRGYSDILIPSHHYWSPSSEFTYEWELKRGRAKEPTDVDWEVKQPSVYWRGKVARGADTPPGRAGSFQKQRLVKMANEVPASGERILVAFNSKTAALSSMSVPFASANDQMSDIAMACDPNLGECAYLRSLGYRVEPPGPLSDAWKHKYVLDLDEIGFSPRFLALMESKSVVLKSSVQQEFWSNWIVPWKHYVPMSSVYAELYNVITFFSGFPEFFSADESIVTTILTRPTPVPLLPTTADGQPFEGDRAAQDIAEAGRLWRQTHVRKQDMECYVYRLMIEWAAILSVPASSEVEG